MPSRVYDRLSRPFQKLLGIHGFSHKMSKLSNILEYENNSDFYEKLNIFDNELLDNKSKYHRNIFDKYQSIDLIDSVQRNDIDFYLPNDILVKVDRASMFNSLEVRSPFLSHNVINKAFELPIEFKLRNKITKYILKDLLSDFLPKSLYIDQRWDLLFQLKDGYLIRNLEKLWIIFFMSHVGKNLDGNEKKY